MKFQTWERDGGQRGSFLDLQVRVYITEDRIKFKVAARDAIPWAFDGGSVSFTMNSLTPISMDLVDAAGAKGADLIKLKPLRIWYGSRIKGSFIVDESEGDWHIVFRNADAADCVGSVMIRRIAKRL